MKLPTPQVWTGQLDTFYPLVGALRSLLSGDELTRVNRYRVPEHGHPFVVGRALLRILLGRFLRLGAEQVPIVYGEQGKPKLAPEVNPDDLQFNLSHSQNHLACAFRTGSRVGIDVESLQRQVDLERLPARVLNDTEQRDWLQLPASQRSRELLRIWIIKEACLKASGVGISGGLRNLAIARRASGVLTATQQGAGVDTSQTWHIHECQVGSDELCAIALEQPSLDVEMHALDELLVELP